jgi:serine/threonine-protein kinase
VLRAHQGVGLPLAAVQHLAVSLCEALQYVHERRGTDGSDLRLVHRDLNPPNVMISRLGEVKLSDFGIARDQTREQLTAEGVMRGKLGYSAPEQLCGEPFDSRADLFSLGVTLHEALTGRRLFTAETDLALMQATLRNPIAQPSASRPEVPPALDAVVMGLVEREVRQRTQHAREVVNAITAIGAPLFDLARGKKQLAGLVERAQRERTATPIAASAAAPLPRPSRPSAEAQTATMNTTKPG